MTALLIGGVDARAAYGFRLSSPSGWRDLAAARYQTAVIPGREGVTLLNDRIDVGPRRLTLRGLLKGSSVADARSKLDQLSVALRGAAGVTVGFSDDTTRELLAVTEQISVEPGAASLISSALAVDVSLLCLSPFARTITPTVVALSGATAALALGTAPVRPVIEITGSGTGAVNPTFTLKDSSGATIGTLTLTMTVAAAETITIDCDAATIMNELGVNKLAFLTAGDFFELDVAELGDFALSAWPTMEVSLGSGTFSAAQITYRRAWLC